LLARHGGLHREQARHAEQWFLRITEYADELLTASKIGRWLATRKRGVIMQRKLDRRTLGGRGIIEILGSKTPARPFAFSPRASIRFGATCGSCAEHPLVRRTRERGTLKAQVKRMIDFQPPPKGPGRISNEKEASQPCSTRFHNPLTAVSACDRIANFVLHGCTENRRVMAVSRARQSRIRVLQAVRHLRSGPVIRPVDGTLEMQAR